MAYVTESTKKYVETTTKPKNSHWVDRFSPGDKVPVSGIYRCVNCQREIAANAKDPLPPQNHHQHQTGKIVWQLIIRADTDPS